MSTDILGLIAMLGCAIAFACLRCQSRKNAALRAERDALAEQLADFPVRGKGGRFVRRGV